MRALGLFVLWAGIAWSEPKTPVELQLVLGADISGSIGERNYRIQRDGLISALRDPEIQNLLSHIGGTGQIGIIYFEWDARQRIRAPWSLIRHDHVSEDIESFIQAIMESTRYMLFYNASSNSWYVPGGSTTNVVGALSYVKNEILPISPYKSNRIIFDISSDGSNSYEEIAVEPIRDELLELNDGDTEMTINAIVLPSLEDDVFDYYRNRVIGGPFSFAVKVDRIENYPRTLRRKIKTEISSSLRLQRLDNL